MVDNLRFLIKKIPVLLFQNYLYSFISVLSGVIGLSALTAKNGIEYIGSIAIFSIAQAIYLAFESGSFQYLTSYYVREHRYKTIKVFNLLKSVSSQTISIVSTLFFIFIMLAEMKYENDAILAIITLIFMSLVGTSLSLLARSQLAAHKKVSLNSKVTAISLTLRYVGLYIISFYTLNIITHTLYLSLIAIVESYLRIVALQKELEESHALEYIPKAPLSSSLSVGIGALAVAGDRWCVGYLYSEKELGIYTLAINIYSVLMNMVSPLISYMLPYLIENASGARDKYFKHLFFLYAAIFSVVVMGALGVFFFKNDFFYNINSDVLLAIIIAGIVYVGGVLNSIAEPIYAQWLLFERFNYISYRNIIAFMYLFLATVFLYFSDFVSLEVIAFFHIVNGLCIYLVNYIANLRVAAK